VNFPLVVQPDGGQPSVFFKHFVIGRLGGYTLADDTVSPFHAQCWPAPDGEWMIQDLGSANWTMVNGERIWAPRALDKGDRVTIGRTVLTMGPAG
jgi:hypothetical protein